MRPGIRGSLHSATAPDLNCGDVPDQGFEVLPPDPHNFDGNNDGIGCEG